MYICHCQAYFGERAHALRAPSWIKSRKRRKGVLGSRGEAKKGVTGEGPKWWQIFSITSSNRQLVNTLTLQANLSSFGCLRSPRTKLVTTR